MDTIDILLESGKSVLQSLHDKNEQETMDDVDYLSIIKSVIHGFSEYLVETSHDPKQISDLKIKLKEHALTLFLILWMKNIEEGENENDVKQEGKEYFQYVYKHGEHPR